MQGQLTLSAKQVGDFMCVTQDLDGVIGVFQPADPNLAVLVQRLIRDITRPPAHATEARRPTARALTWEDALMECTGPGQTQDESEDALASSAAAQAVQARYKYKYKGESLWLTPTTSGPT